MDIKSQLGESITSEVTGNTYFIQDYIDSGAFSDVFACVDTWGNELVIKILREVEGLQEPEIDGLNETNKLMHVRHPNIVHVYDAFNFQGKICIVSERCDFSLRQLMSQNWFDGKIWFSAIAKGLLQAVHFSHVQQLVHFDIHFGNIFGHRIKDDLLPEDRSAVRFKLGDFGIARPRASDLDGGIVNQTVLAPEIIDSAKFGKVDIGVDVFQCGLILLQVYMGKMITFKREQIVNGEPREMALKLPAPFSFAIEKALRRRVAYRTASAIEMWRDLNSNDNVIVTQ